MRGGGRGKGGCGGELEWDEGIFNIGVTMLPMVIKPLVLFFGGIDEEGCNGGMKINMAARINSPENVLFPGIIRWADVGR